MTKVFFNYNLILFLLLLNATLIYKSNNMLCAAGAGADNKTFLVAGNVSRGSHQLALQSSSFCHYYLGTFCTVVDSRAGSKIRTVSGTDGTADRLCGHHRPCCCRDDDDYLTMMSGGVASRCYVLYYHCCDSFWDLDTCAGNKSILPSCIFYKALHPTCAFQR